MKSKDLLGKIVMISHSKSLTQKLKVFKSKTKTKKSLNLFQSIEDLLLIHMLKIKRNKKP